MQPQEMGTVLSRPPSLPGNPPPLYAAIDMGTNSFKMLIVHTDPSTGKFLALDRIKEPVLLGQSLAPISTPSSITQFSISSEFQFRAISALHNFNQFLQSHPITSCHVVATSAVREAANQRQFLSAVREKLGFEVQVLSGEEEAKYVYLGILQFFPYYSKLILCIDIGGGSTEIVIGKFGKLQFAKSLKLGHVTLTEQFVKNGEISETREHIRKVIKQSGVVEEVKKFDFEVVVGSSGTIRAIEKAVFHGYGLKLVGNVVNLGEVRRDWRFSNEELRNVVESLCGEEERCRRDGFFKRRSEFITSGAILLEEIFEAFGIGEMEVSEYALGEGVIAERLDCDLNTNVRWRSVVRLATRFNGRKKMKSSAQCASIAKEIFEGLKKCEDFVHSRDKLTVSLDEKDLEYLEAACLLHNIGLFSGIKGYHKQSYRIIMNGDHLHGYSAQEVKLIAMLARYHRKKFPKLDNDSFKEFPEEVRKKFNRLCAIIRISVIVQQCQSVICGGLGFPYSHGGFKLVVGELKDGSLGNFQFLHEAFEAEYKNELKHFRKVCQQNLWVIAPSCSLQSSFR